MSATPVLDLGEVAYREAQRHYSTIQIPNYTRWDELPTSERDFWTRLARAVAAAMPAGQEGRAS